MADLNPYEPPRQPPDEAIVAVASKRNRVDFLSRRLAFWSGAGIVTNVVGSGIIVAANAPPGPGLTSAEMGIMILIACVISVPLYVARRSAFAVRAGDRRYRTLFGIALGLLPISMAFWVFTAFFSLCLLLRLWIEYRWPPLVRPLLPS